MKIVTVVGARPQFIKAASLSREITKHNDIEEIIVHTGQHFDANMSDVFFEEMEIPKPNYFLNINGLTHGAMTGIMLQKIEEVLMKEKPDYTLVYGDTNSTLAAALASVKLEIKIIHVEAGLRSFDFSVPEEVNRVITDRLANLLICPTDIAVHNLKQEGFDKFQVKIVKTGDIMVDAFRYYTSKMEVNKNSTPFVLCTIHRQNNTTSGKIKEIVAGLNQIAESIKIKFPIHPRTQNIIKQEGLTLHHNIKHTPPVGYVDLMKMLIECKYVITDSGGLQREAYLAKKNSMIIMDFTPWEELADGRYTILANANKEDLIEKFEKVKIQTPDYSTNFYGNGYASNEIIQAIQKFKNNL